MEYLAIHRHIDNLITLLPHKPNIVRIPILGHQITPNHIPPPTAEAILGIIAIIRIKATTVDSLVQDMTMDHRRVVAVVLKIVSGHQALEAVETRVQNSLPRHHHQAVGHLRALIMRTTHLEPRVKNDQPKTKVRRRTRKMGIKTCILPLETLAHLARQEGAVDSALPSKPKQHPLPPPNLFLISRRECRLTNHRLGHQSPRGVGLLPVHPHDSNQICALIAGIEIGTETEVANVIEAEIASEGVIGTEVETGGTSAKDVVASASPGAGVIIGEKTVGLKTAAIGSVVTSGQISDQRDQKDQKEQEVPEGVHRCQGTSHSSQGSGHRSRSCPGRRSSLGQSPGLPFRRNMPSLTLCIIESQGMSLL